MEHYKVDYYYNYYYYRFHYRIKYSSFSMQSSSTIEI